MFEVDNQINVFTVDLEDWYYSREYEKTFQSGDFFNQRNFLYESTLAILQILNDNKIKATFFTLGKLAEYEPQLIEEIISFGHEIACHGYDHVNISRMTSDELRYDLEKSISIIKRITGKEVKGYRAPNFSICKRTEWAFYVLKEFDIVYDSSVQPFGYHPQYGDNSVPLTPYRHSSGIIEVPLSCYKFLSVRIPCSGGGYFRHFPYSVFSTLFQKSGKQNRYSTFYIHPWEFGYNNNPIEVNGIAKYRKYHNADKVEFRLKKLLDEFDFSPMDELIERVR